MEANDQDGDPWDLWVTLLSLGYNRALEMTEVGEEIKEQKSLHISLLQSLCLPQTESTATIQGCHCPDSDNSICIFEKRNFLLL